MRLVQIDNLQHTIGAQASLRDLLLCHVDRSMLAQYIIDYSTTLFGRADCVCSGSLGGRVWDCDEYFLKPVINRISASRNRDLSPSPCHKSSAR
jgi:hypothetical protein